MLNFDAALRAAISDRLDRFQVKAIINENLKRAAVAFAVIGCEKDAAIGGLVLKAGQHGQAGFLLTTRSASLSSHASQRAFPGGRLDDNENAEQAALRELEEEVGIQLDASTILGRLDDYATRSGYVITPVVVWIEDLSALQPNPDEVALVHQVPLNELLRDDAPLLETLESAEQPALRMPLGNEWFAAPSAAIAYQFREVALLGRDTRVSHFDQPRFAWQ